MISSPPHEVYSRHLAGVHGYPLWTPQLKVELPEDYQLEGLKIGDVGIVSPVNGSFDVLFNITLPRDEQPFPELVREGFTPVILSRQRDLDTQPDAVSPTQGVFPRGSVQLIFAHVHDRDQEPSRADYEFSLSTGDGAVLVLPEGAESRDLKNEKTFLGEAIRHGVDWYECATETAGRLINNDSLYLITGFHKARSWSLGAADGGGSSLQNQRSLTLEVGQIHKDGITARAYRWAVVQGFMGRVGPESPYEIPNYITDERRRGVNQTIFIRGFRITVNRILFLKTVSVETRQGTFGGLGAYVNNLLWHRTSESASSSGTKDATDNAVEQDSSVNHGQLYMDTRMTIDRVPSVSQTFHPGDSINRYMLKKEPRAMVAVTHDNVWIEMLQMGLLELGDFSREVCLEKVLSENYQITMEDGKYCAVCLRRGHGLESRSHKQSGSTSLSSLPTGSIKMPSISDPRLECPGLDQPNEETIALEEPSQHVPSDQDIIQKRVTTLESNGDKAMESKDPKRAIAQYSAALSLRPPKAADLFVKRSTAQGTLGLWEGALKDADMAIKQDPSSPWGYERRYAALHGLRRYDDAMDAFTRMLSLIEGSVHHELAKKYVAPPRLETIIDSIVHGVIGVSPLVLIDVKDGRLCDGSERLRIFKSEPQYKELIFSMTEVLDMERIQLVVDEYFRYVMLSHVWEGEEPSFQDVEWAGSVWKLDSSPLNEKLRNFCTVVRTDGYRWAWSDTCCIDKTISAVLNRSLKMMYKWYEASAATFVLLVDVDSLSARGGLRRSIWMTRAWASQELLAPKVVRFYTRDWQPYLGDTRSNHKESPEIVQELTDAIRIARENIISFNPNDLTAREKLRLASTRNATIEEDMAYSLIGIFQSDIRPSYGERHAALGHLLEEVVTRSGDVTVLAWTGKSSPYNSCLPASLAVYSQPPDTLLAIDDADMDVRVSALRNSLPQEDALFILGRVNRLTPARFANRRLRLPCIVFTVRWLGMQYASGPEKHYRARVSGIGDVEFRTSDELQLTEPRKLILVHPWIRDLCDPHDGFTRGSTVHDDDESDAETEPGSAPTSPVHPAPALDNFIRALRLIVRLQQPFHALLLQQQRPGEFKRVAAEHKIVVQGIQTPINFANLRTRVVEVL